MTTTSRVSCSRVRGVLIRIAFKRTDFERFVIIGRSADNRAAEIGFAHAEMLSEHLLRSPHESHIVINLGKLFERLERGG